MYRKAMGKLRKCAKAGLYDEFMKVLNYPSSSDLTEIVCKAFILSEVFIGSFYYNCYMDFMQ